MEQASISNGLTSVLDATDDALVQCPPVRDEDINITEALLKEKSDTINTNSSHSLAPKENIDVLNGGIDHISTKDDYKDNTDETKSENISVDLACIENNEVQDVDNNEELTKDESVGNTNINNSFGLTPAENTDFQEMDNNEELTNYESVHNANINNSLGVTPAENTEVQEIGNNEALTKDESVHNTNINNSEKNSHELTAVENTETTSVDDSLPAPDDFANYIESINASINEESVCKPIMETCEEERIEKENSSSKSPVSSRSGSPDPEMFDSHINENETSGRASRKHSSLPYFQLPNPDLDEYLIQTDEFLSVNKNNSFSSIKLDKEQTAPKRKSMLDEFLANFETEKTPTSLQTDSKNDEVSRTPISNEYTKVIACLGQLDESKSPGIKRIALKEFLKKKINEKKSAAFNRSKEISNLDENEEIEFDVDEDKEKVNSEAESSDEDYEEQTVSLSAKEPHENGEDEEAQTHHGESDEDDIDYIGDEGLQIHSNDESDEDNIEDEEAQSEDESDEDILTVRRKSKKAEEKHGYSDDESDEDISAVREKPKEADEKQRGSDDDSDEDILTVRRKSKPLQILEEDSNDASHTETDFAHEQKTAENNEKQIDSQNGSFPNGQSADSQIKMGFADIPSYQPVTSVPENMDESSSDSLASEIQKRNSFKNSLNFSERDLSSRNNSPIPMSMDDPPLMLSGHEPLMGDLFLSQDLAALCSGSFKSKEKNNELISVSDEEDDGNEISSIDKNPPPKEGLKLNDFFELEAELSGEDDGEGEDDPESDGEGLEELIASDHELPSNAQLRDEIADLHMKHLLDDDERILNEYKEKFLDDGELHGDGRARKFAWKNDAVDIDDSKNQISSESEDEGPADSWSSMNQEKAKWRQENKEEEEEEELVADNLNSSYKNILKVKIVGKMEFSQPSQESSKRLSCKRPRGSFLHLDNSSASQVLKKLKTSEDVGGGSRTTKHFVFRNDLLSEEGNVITKQAHTNVAKDPIPTIRTSNNRSIFSKI